MFELVYLFLYVAALCFALLDGGFRREILHRFMTLFLFLSFALHLFWFSRSWFSTGVIPSRNLTELLDTTALMLVAVYLLSSALVKNREIPFFLMPFVVSFLFLSKILEVPVPETKPYFTTPWFPIHIFLLVGGMAAILFSFIYSAIFIMQDYSLRKKKTPNAMYLPTIDEAERFGKIYLLTGFALLTLGFFSSAAYGITHATRDTDYRPGLLEAGTLISWLLLGIASFGWIRASMKPKKRILLLMAGASFFLFIFLGMLWH